MSNMKDAQIQRTDFFFGAAEKRAEFLAEPACDCGACSCPACSMYDCTCDCPACVPNDTVSQVENAIMLGAAFATSVAAAAAAGLASTLLMSPVSSASSTAHNGWHAGTSVLG